MHPHFEGGGVQKIKVHSPSFVTYAIERPDPFSILPYEKKSPSLVVSRIEILIGEIFLFSFLFLSLSLFLNAATPGYELLPFLKGHSIPNFFQFARILFFWPYFSPPPASNSIFYCTFNLFLSLLQRLYDTCRRPPSVKLNPKEECLFFFHDSHQKENRDENVGEREKIEDLVVAKIYGYSIIISQARRAIGFVYSLFYLVTVYKTRRVNYFPVDPAQTLHLTSRR